MADDLGQDVRQLGLIGDLEQDAVHPVPLALAALQVDHELADLDRRRQLMTDVVERRARQQIRFGNPLGEVELQPPDHRCPGREWDVDEVRDEGSGRHPGRPVRRGDPLTLEGSLAVRGPVRREDTDDRLGGTARVDDALERGIDDHVDAELALDRGGDSVDGRQLAVLADELALGRVDRAEHDEGEHDDAAHGHGG